MARLFSVIGTPPLSTELQAPADVDLFARGSSALVAWDSAACADVDPEREIPWLASGAAWLTHLQHLELTVLRDRSGAMDRDEFSRFLGVPRVVVEVWDWHGMLPASTPEAGADRYRWDDVADWVDAWRRSDIPDWTNQDWVRDLRRRLVREVESQRLEQEQAADVARWGFGHPSLSDDFLRERTEAAWVPELNAGLDYRRIDTAHDRQAYVWRCAGGHAYSAKVRDAWRGCEVFVCTTPGLNDLATVAPSRAVEWSARNLRSAREVKSAHGMEAWFTCGQCGVDYKAKVDSLTKCGCRDTRMSSARLIALLRSLREHIADMDPTELYTALGAVWSAKNTKVGKQFLASVTKTRRDVDELGSVESAVRAITGDPGCVDDAIRDLGTDPRWEPLPETTLLDQIPADAPHKPTAATLPALHVRKVLQGASTLWAAPEDQVEFLIEKRVHQLRLAMYAAYAETTPQVVRGGLLDEFEQTRAHVTGEGENEFVREVATRFIAEYDAARSYTTPAGWSFRPEGEAVVQPNMMQRNVACRVVDKQYVGNWSGMGGGKTISAILAYETLRQHKGVDGICVVVCPNNTIETWDRQITGCYPDSEVQAQTFTPRWRTSGGRWLLINYDRLQDRNDDAIRDLLTREHVALLVVDEVHFAKQGKGPESQRRRQLLQLRVGLGHHHPDAAVLVMSGTPSINDLAEVKSLLELQWADKAPFQLDALATKINEANGMAMHQALVLSGLRWKPEFALDVTIDWPQLEAAQQANAIASRWADAGAGQRDAMMAAAKLHDVVDRCARNAQQGRKTIVYSYFVDGISDPAYEALTAAGLTVLRFFGGTEESLDAFTDPDHPAPADVLLGGRMIGTGVDGLQRVCSDMIFLSLPYTHAEFEQAKARVVRQGQTEASVRITIPQVWFNHGPAAQRFAYDEYRYSFIDSKATVSHLVVDGILPTRTAADLTPAEVARTFDKHLRELERTEAA